MRYIHFHSFLLLVAMIAVLLATPVMADIYFWTDENGVQHFSNQEKPSDATLYLSAPPPAPYEPVKEQERDTVDKDAAEIADKLEKTNRKLESVLEQVEELTEEVERSRREAQESAAAARLAAVQAARAESQYVTEEREPAPAAVIFGVHSKGFQNDRGPKPGYFKQDTRLYPYYDRTHDAKRGPERSSRASDFNERFRQPSDFNERFRQPSAFERQYIQRVPAQQQTAPPIQQRPAPGQGPRR